MTQLYLHIGHMKTGSSALQVVFARSADALAGHGIVYPEHRASQNARAGRMTAGNVSAVALVERVNEEIPNLPAGHRLLFSNEDLGSDLVSDDSRIRDLIAGGVDVSLLLVLRNPVELALSLYRQQVKYSGYTGTVERFLETFLFIDRLAVILRVISEENVPVTFACYDREKDHLVQRAESWLSVPAGTLTGLPDAPVNRSSTAGEDLLLRGLSARLGVSGSDYLGRALSEGAPDAPTQVPWVSRDGYDQFVNRIRPIIDEVNTHLPAEYAREITPYETLYGTDVRDENAFTFSKLQLEIMAEALASRAPSAELVKAYVQLVMSLKAGHVLSDKDILCLNQMGQVFRPGKIRPARIDRLRKKADRDKGG